MALRAVGAAILFLLALLAGCASPAADEAPTPSLSAGTTAVGGDPTAKVVSVYPGTYNFTGPYSSVVTPGTLGIRAVERITIPSPIDGGDIEMGINRPDTDAPVPILVFASPYFDAEGSISGTLYETAPDVAGQYYGPERPVTSQLGSFGALITNFVPHGYAVVAVAVRGTAGSDGCNDLMGPDEITDLDAAITWLGEQPWSTGAIAMTGVSYDGSTPWSVASRGNPHLKTIIPISGVPDIYGLMYRNGSSESRGPLLLNALYIEGGISSGTPAEAPGRVCAEALEGLALSGVAGVIGNDPTGYWQARNRKPGVEANYKGSVFSVQGLYDWNVDSSQVIPWVDHLESLGIRTKQLLGQWNHNWPDNLGNGEGTSCPDGNAIVAVCDRADWKESVLHWLDHELKGIDVDTGPAVQVADDLGRWRNEAHYPPHDANWTTYFLGGDGTLQTSPGAGADVPLLPILAPLPEGSRPSQVNIGLDFAEYKLSVSTAKDMLVVGLPKVPIQVTPLGPGGYIGAFLYDRAPNEVTGRTIGFTTMNLAFADGTTTFKPVVPGVPIKAMLEVQPMDSVILAGHELVLRIWVFTDTNGDNARVPTIPPSPVLLHVGDAASVFRLPTVERGPEVYFTPPTPEARTVA